MGGSGDNGGRGARHTDGVLLVGYCAVCGLLASTVGAASSLLADGTRAKLITWVLVAATISLVAGAWWGYSPAAVRRAVLVRVHRPGRRRGGREGTDPRRSRLW